MVKEIEEAIHNYKQSTGKKPEDYTINDFLTIAQIAEIDSENVKTYILRNYHIEAGASHEL